MGTDIHGVFQRHDGAKWVDVPSAYEEGRHYQLFAVLAGVRNGHGFAGVPTGDEITPISNPRGLPDDFAMLSDESHPVALEVWNTSPMARHYEPGDDGFGSFWMGDHSHSWLTAEEMLAWAEAAPVVQKVGIIKSEEFATWQKGTRPAEYCGGVSGPNVAVIEQTAAEAGSQGSHVRVRWHSKLREELDYFFGEVARLAAAHGRIRYVFGFDS